MPNLINSLKNPAELKKKKPKQSEEERKKELQRLLASEKPKDGEERIDQKTGMEWGTCLVFTCQNNCCDPSLKEFWTEEVVLVQWEV